MTLKSLFCAFFLQKAWNTLCKYYVGSEKYDNDNFGCLLYSVDTTLPEPGRRQRRGKTSKAFFFIWKRFDNWVTVVTVVIGEEFFFVNQKAVFTEKKNMKTSYTKKLYFHPTFFFHKITFFLKIFLFRKNTFSAKSFFH